MAERTIVTSVSNAVLYSDGTIRLDKVRVSFPHVGTPGENTDEAGNKTTSFGIAGMLPKKTHTAAKDLVKKVIQQLITDNSAKVPPALWFLKNGDDTEREEYQGHFIISASDRKRRPTVRHPDGQTMTVQEADDMIYGGCYCDLLIRPWYFNGKAKNGKSYPKRICAGLIAVRFVRDGEPFGEGRIDDEGVFESDDGESGFDDDDDGGGL